MFAYEALHAVCNRQELKRILHHQTLPDEDQLPSDSDCESDTTEKKNRPRRDQVVDG